MYTYDDDNDVFEGDCDLVSKIGEEGNVLHMQARLNTSRSDVVKATKEYMLQNRNKDGEPFMYAEVSVVLTSMEVVNDRYKEMLLAQAEGQKTGKPKDDGRGGM